MAAGWRSAGRGGERGPLPVRLQERRVAARPAEVATSPTGGTKPKAALAAHNTPLGPSWTMHGMQAWVGRARPAKHRDGKSGSVGTGRLPHTGGLRQKRGTGMTVR